jgi:S-(hydroxymethyl)glutathione dehydrogenase/alcohol dehydrogenase
VCHTDLHYMRGDLTCRLPAVLGHEGAGVVEQVGADVARFAPGDDVVMMWRPRCGHCEYCATGRPALCASSKRQVQSGGLLDGTTRLSAGGERVHHLLGVSCFAEYAVVNQESLVHIPAGTPPEIAAITGCAVITGVGAVLNVAGSTAGQACLVVGAGGVGLSAVMGAQLVGAYPIIVSDIDAAKLEFARSLGATHVVNSAEAPLEDAVAEIAPGGVSWAFEAVGASATVRAAMACLRPGGTTVAIGLGSVGTVVEVALNDLVQRDKRLVGSLYGSSNTTVQIPRLLELHAAGRLPLDRLLGQRFDLEHINEAYSGLAARALGRAVITMDGSA